MRSGHQKAGLVARACRHRPSRQAADSEIRNLVRFRRSGAQKKMAKPVEPGEIGELGQLCSVIPVPGELLVGR